MFKIVLLLNHNNLINFFKRFFYNLIEMAIQKRGTTMFERINQYLHLTVKCHLRNGKSFVGFDFHMNVVLENSSEFRRVRKRRDKNVPNSKFVIKEEKRQLGIIILCGEYILSMAAVEGQQPVARAAPSRRGPRTSHPGSGSRYVSSRSTARSQWSKRGGRY